MKKQTVFKIVSIIIGIFIGLVILEGGYRFYHFLTFHNIDELKPTNRKPLNDPNTEKTLGQIIQISNEPKIIYELIPNSMYIFKGALVRTNEKGFRDKSYPARKEDKTTRIIGLGDSVMFGWGVEEENCYLSQLESELNRNGSGKYEIINTAVPGYNTVMEVEVLKKKINLEDVDFVIINFVTNDFDLPNFIRKKPDYLGIKKSMILQLFEDKKGFDERLRNAPYDEENKRLERDAGKVPAQYRDMVGEQSYLKALAELKRLSEIYNFQVILLISNPYLKVPPVIKEISEKCNFEYLDIKPYWKHYKERHPGAKWSLSESDPHPSLQGHTLISVALKERIMEAQNERLGK